MNERIKIFKKENKVVAGRRVENSLELFYECWAEFNDLYGKEVYTAIDSRLENAANFKIRYSKKLEELMNKEKFIIE